MVARYKRLAGEATYSESADHGLTKKITPGTGTPTQFHYDARLQRYCIDWAGTVNYYAWDGLNQIVEKDANLDTVAQHTHGESAVVGIGTVAVTKRGSEYQYPHYDHRGSLFELEDTGAADLAAEYNAWGEELSRTGAAVTRFGYQGTAWMRPNSGLLFSPTRLYSPGLGRFGQMDPLFRLSRVTGTGALPLPWRHIATDSANMVTALERLLGTPRYYSFAQGNPSEMVDPTGLRKVCVASFKRGPQGVIGMHSRRHQASPGIAYTGGTIFSASCRRGSGDFWTRTIVLVDFGGVRQPMIPFAYAKGTAAIKCKFDENDRCVVDSATTSTDLQVSGAGTQPFDAHSYVWPRDSFRSVDGTEVTIRVEFWGAIKGGRPGPIAIGEKKVDFVWKCVCGPAPGSVAI